LQRKSARGQIANLEAKKTGGRLLAVCPLFEIKPILLRDHPPRMQGKERLLRA
jgi:hypothetical protein